MSTSTNLVKSAVVLNVILLFADKVIADDRDCLEASDAYTDSISSLRSAREVYKACIANCNGNYYLCSEKLRNLNSSEDAIESAEFFYHSKCD